MTTDHLHPSEHIMYTESMNQYDSVDVNELSSKLQENDSQIEIVLKEMLQSTEQVSSTKTDILKNIQSLINQLEPLLEHRKYLDKTIQKSLQIFRNVVQDQTEFIVRYQPNGTRTFVNEAYCRYFDQPYDKLVGTSFFPLVADEDRPSIVNKIKSFTPENPVATEVHRAIRPDGSLSWQQWTDRAIFNQEGEIIELLAVGRDISDRKRIEVALQQVTEGLSTQTGTAFFKSLVQHLSKGSNADYAFVGQFGSGSPNRVETIAVCAQNKITDNFQYDLLDTPCFDVFNQQLCIHPGGVQKFFPKDLLLQDMEVEGYAGTPLIDSRGNTLGILVILSKQPFMHVDLIESLLKVFAVRAATELERQQSEILLRNSESQFRRLFDYAPEALLLYEINQEQIIDANLNALTLTDYNKSQLQELQIEKLLFFNPDEQQSTIRNINKLINESLIENETVVEMMLQGSVRTNIPCIVRLIQLPAENRKLVRISIIDISEKQKDKEHIRQEKDFSEMLINSSVDGILAFDNEFRYTLWNPAMEKISGFTKDKCLGKCAFDVFPFLLESGEDENFKRALEGEFVAVTDRPFVIPGGHSGYFEGYYSPLFDQNKKIFGGIAIIRDITERKKEEEKRNQLQQQLRQAQKLEAIGTLAAGMAHDMNNMLTAIIGYSDLIKNNSKDENKVIEYANELQASAHQGSDIINSLLTFTRRDICNKQIVHLGGLIKESVRMLRRLISATVELKIQVPDEDSLTIFADASQIRQVIINLVVNARDSMPNGGQIMIDISRQTELSDIKSRENSTTRDFIILKVEDSGEGMSEEVQERVFDPFYTTKPRGKGTGLGLAIVHGIIMDHDGQIDIKSTPGVGTSVSIYLPHCDHKQTTIHTGSPKNIQKSFDPTILIVEDNSQVRAIISQVFEDSGYIVLSATDGIAGLEVFEKNIDEIQFVIMDIELPKMNGVNCLNRIHALRTDIPTIIITGGSDVQLDNILTKNKKLLKKPFTMTDLLTSVDELSCNVDG